jgi:cold shock CspA family protein
MQGYIDYWNAPRSFAFILTDDGGRYFAHRSSFAPEIQDKIAVGRICEFEVGKTARGLIALDVRFVQHIPKEGMAKLGGAA